MNFIYSFHANKNLLNVENRVGTERTAAFFGKKKSHVQKRLLIAEGRS